MGNLLANLATFWGERSTYNHRRYHESIGNVTPADTCFGRDHVIIERKRKIKNLTIQKAAWLITSNPLNINQDEPKPPLDNRLHCPIYSDDGHGL